LAVSGEEFAWGVFLQRQTLRLSLQLRLAVGFIDVASFVALAVKEGRVATGLAREETNLLSQVRIARIIDHVLIVQNLEVVLA